MRNLKKFLALALAVMMTFSLMVTANAAIDTSAAVTDKDSITEEFKEAVAVLNGLKIITGYETGDNEYEFRPEKPISRQEATALVYRLHSGDADNVKNNLYSTADNIAKFKDVNPNGAQQWSAGYIGYCANQEIIKGVGADRFNPTGNVTGYQMLAMVLRAIGYGQRGEYEGTGWQTRVATTATNLGMLKNIDDTNYAGTLSAPATRELVAEIVFQAALREQVIWNEAFGYVSKNDITGLALKSLGKENFQLDYTAYTTVDEWGRPGYYWFRGSDLKSDLSNVVTTITPKPEKSYTTSIRECDLAHDLGIASSANFDLYVNDNLPITKSYLVVATDTTTKVGGQGRLTEVYRNLRNGKGGVDNRVVMVDTFLAKVTGVSKSVVDAAGHVIVPAKLNLDVYDDTDLGNPSSPRTVTKGANDASNWEYSVGDMILLNAYTDHDGTQDSGTVLTLHTEDDAKANLAAFETEQVELKNSAPLKETNTADQATELNYVEILGVAKSTVAKQTVVYWNQEKHSVGGTDYPDQLNLVLDVAGTTVNSDFTWYFDQYGNIIGIGEAVRSNYGVITSLYSSFSTADGATDGKAVAKAHVKYADGTEADVIIDRFVVASTDKTDTTSVWTGGHNAAGTAMRVEATANSLELLPVYDYSVGSANVMTGGDAAAGYSKPSDVATTGQLYVSPVASINKAAEKVMNGLDDGTGTAEADSAYYGIIEQNLFKFVTSGNGKMTAIEVAGKNDDATATNNNDGMYVGHNNANDDTNASELKKNAGFVSVNSTVIRLNNNTQIILKEGNSINVYNGLNSLPGDVTIAKLTEVDWVDANGDDIADVLYATATVKGNVVHGLFYYNGGVGQWDGVNGKGSLAGYLNGEATTLNFSHEKLFNLVKNSTEDYEGHIFAVEVTNGEVTNLFGKASTTAGASTFGERFASNSALALNSGTTAGLMPNTIKPLSGIELANGITTATYAAADAFKTGTDGGNNYTKDTQVVADDVIGGAGTYDTAKGIVTLGGNEYSLVGTSKILGHDLSYLNLAGRECEVTIVFENNSVHSIVEIYVSTPDNTTPVGPGNTVTFGPDIVKVPSAVAGDGAGSVGAWLKNVAGNGGVYYADAKVNAGDQAGVGNLLYFPFIADSQSFATLTIRDASGNMRFSETSTVALGVGPHIFRFDFLSAPGAWYGPTRLSAGTYSYSITVGNSTVSNGTFTLIAQ